MGGVAATRHPTLALVLAAAVSFFPSAPLAASAAEGRGPSVGSVQGFVLDAASGQPLAGAIVHLRNPRTGNVLSSAPATPAGAFRLGPVPAATYALAVEAEGGFYLAAMPVEVGGGSAIPLNLAVQRSARAQPGPGGNGEDEQAKKDKRRYPSAWDNPLTATLIVLGAAVVIGVIVENLTEDEEEQPPASPSLPGP